MHLCAIINRLWKKYLIYFINEGDKAFLSSLMFTFLTKSYMINFDEFRMNYRSLTHSIIKERER